MSFALPFQAPVGVPPPNVAGGASATSQPNANPAGAVAAAPNAFNFAGKQLSYRRPFIDDQTTLLFRTFIHYF